MPQSGERIKCRNAACTLGKTTYEEEFLDGQDVGDYCSFCQDELRAGTLVPVGVGSRQRRWSCQCTEHVSNGRVKPGPYAFRGPASTQYSTFCQYCDAVFALEPEAPAKKRKSVPCGAHCPAGSHTHV